MPKKWDCNMGRAQGQQLAISAINHPNLWKSD